MTLEKSPRKMGLGEGELSSLVLAIGKEMEDVEEHHFSQWSPS